MERLTVDVVQFCCAIAKFLLLDQRLSIAYTQSWDFSKTYSFPKTPSWS